MAKQEMSHPLIEILEGIVYDRMTDMEADGDVDFDAVFELYKARASAAFEARDLAVATAVRDAILERNRLGWEKLPALNLVEIIRSVK